MRTPGVALGLPLFSGDVINGVSISTSGGTAGSIICSASFASGGKISISFYSSCSSFFSVGGMSFRSTNCGSVSTPSDIWPISFSVYTNSMCGDSFSQ